MEGAGRVVLEGRVRERTGCRHNGHLQFQLVCGAGERRLLSLFQCSLPWSVPVPAVVGESRS